jgi:hypothetical protein
MKISNSFKNRLRKQFLQVLQIILPYKGMKSEKETHFDILSLVPFPIYSSVFVHLQERRQQLSG